MFVSTITAIFAATAVASASPHVIREDTSICTKFGAGFFGEEGPFELFAFNTSLGVANTTGARLRFAPTGTETVTWVLAVSSKPPSPRARAFGPLELRTVLTTMTTFCRLPMAIPAVRTILLSS